MADKTLAQLKTLLGGDTYKAFRARVNDIIELRVKQRTAVIEEQHNVELRATKDKLQRKAEDYTRNHKAKLEATMNKVLQEAKELHHAEMASALLLLESKLVERLDSVLEESVNVSTPREILEEAARASHLGKITNVLATVMEEQAIVVGDSGVRRTIEELEKKVSALGGKLIEEQTSRAAAEQREVQLRKDLLLESKTSELPAADRKRVVALLQESSYEHICDNIDKTIELLQESRKTERRGRAQQQNDVTPPATDVNPGVRMDGGSRLVEEEVKRTVPKDARPPVIIEEQSEVQSPLFNDIDGLLP